MRAPTYLFTKFVFTVCLLASVWTPRSEASITLAELLDLKPGEIGVIVHMDDGGMIHSANSAMADLRKFGLAKSASGMFSCPAISEFVQLARTGALDDIGVHLTLTSEWRNYRWGATAPPALVLSLLNTDGFLWPDLARLFYYGADRDGAIEFEAQIQRALNFGLRPTHIDTHMGSVFVKNSWFKSYLRLAYEYRLPPTVSRWGYFLSHKIPGMELLKENYQKFSRAAEGAGFVLVDDLVWDTVKKTRHEQLDAYKKILRSLKPGVTEIIIHPAYADQEFRAKVMSSKTKEIRRDFDAYVFMNPEITSLIKELHIRVIGWKDIAAVYPWRHITLEQLNSM